MFQLNSPLKHQPPFKFATVFNSSTEENLRDNHPAMYKYMTDFNTQNIKEAINLLRTGWGSRDLWRNYCLCKKSCIRRLHYLLKHLFRIFSTIFTKKKQHFGKILF